MTDQERIEEIKRNVVGLACPDEPLDGIEIVRFSKPELPDDPISFSRHFWSAEILKILKRQFLSHPWAIGISNDVVWLISQLTQKDKQIEGMRKMLVAITSNPHLDLGDLVYYVRDREMKGWDGPAVKQWSDTVMEIKQALKDWKEKG